MTGDLTDRATDVRDTATGVRDRLLAAMNTLPAYPTAEVIQLAQAVQVLAQVTVELTEAAP